MGDPRGGGRLGGQDRLPGSRHDLAGPFGEAMAATSVKSAVYQRAESLGLPTGEWRRAVGPAQAREAYEGLLPLCRARVCVNLTPARARSASTAWSTTGPTCPWGSTCRSSVGCATSSASPMSPGCSCPGCRASSTPSTSCARRRDCLPVSYGPSTTRRMSRRRGTTRSSMAMSEALLAELGVAPLGNVQCARMPTGQCFWRSTRGRRQACTDRARRSASTCSGPRSGSCWPATPGSVKRPRTIRQPMRTTTLPGDHVVGGARRGRRCRSPGTVATGQCTPVQSPGRICNQSMSYRGRVRTHGARPDGCGRPSAAARRRDVRQLSFVRRNYEHMLN